jgi:hypothetical protein
MDFDIVLDMDTMPIFTGTPDEIREWVRRKKVGHDRWVFIEDRKLCVTVREYLARR